MSAEAATKPKPEQDERTGRFLPGNSGNGGRPRGSRNQLGEAMLADLYADWLQHGAEAIKRVCESRPVEYLRIVALIVSKCEVNLEDEMRDAAVEQFIEERRQKAPAMIAKMDEAE